MTKKELEKIYDYASDFQEGRARVVLNGKYGHFDENGKVTTPIIFQYVGNFDYERAYIQVPDKGGYIYLDGNIETEYPHDFIKAAFND